MIKAIETKYNGYRFRSRLEARWAVVFDTLGISYWYEHEGYDLGSGLWYLPDFYLDKLQAYVEVKPYSPTTAERKKARILARETGLPITIVYGTIPLTLNHFFAVGYNESGKLIENQRTELYSTLQHYDLVNKALSSALEAGRSARF